MLNRVKELLIGPPLPTQELAEKRLNKIRALAAFSPDALSSIAYANQEIYLGLLVAGSAGLALASPLGLAITGLLAIVALSYFQTLAAYPSGGGSYIVARDNLGSLAGLVTAAALLVDYLLTAAVSLTASVEAIASAFPALWPHRVTVALVLLAIITLANLRGLRETGTLMSIPVYLFLFTYLPMLLYGFIRLLRGDAAAAATAAPVAAQPLTVLLALRAFATGCTALTGIEAISNGVPSFQPPEARNAGRTLIVMAILMGVLFTGSIGITQWLGVVAGPQETILSALARQILGPGPFYFLVQISTMLILAVAANTSFAGFPRLAAILAADGFLPRQLTNLGDRLVFANGIVTLALATGFLIVLFGGVSHALIPLFAVGVFLAFSLSQAGMVRHWLRVRGAGWRWKAAVNGLGAAATLGTLLIVVVGKFVAGAWITIVLLPMLVLSLRQIRAHYLSVGRQLALTKWPVSLKAPPAPRVVMPVSGIHQGIVQAVLYAESISRHITALYVEVEPGTGQGMRVAWEERFPHVPLVVVPSPYRSIIRPLLEFLDATDRQHNDGRQATVILPEFIPAHWWQSLLHNQSAWLIKTALLHRSRRLGFQRVIIDIPYHLER